MNREILYRNVLRGLQESPQFNSCDLSPMTSLTNTLLEASLANTPCKRLSLSSTLSETPKSCSKSCKSPSSLSVTNESTNSDGGALSSSEKSPLSTSSILSSPRNKENLPTPYYSPSHGQIVRHRQSPLREVQNTATRNLSFSPLKKPVSPARRQHLSPIEKLPLLDECDSNSRDSGYSESGQKKDGFCVPRSCAPTRRLNLDLSPKLSPSEGRKIRDLASLRKEKSDEDEFFKFISGEEDLPIHEIRATSAFSSLLSAPIQSSQSSTVTHTPQAPRLPIRRCLSLVDASTPLSFRVKAAKPEPPKCEESEAPAPRTFPLPVPPFKRPQSPPITPNVSEAKRRKEDPSSPRGGSHVSSHPQDCSKLPLAKRQLSDPDSGSKDVPRARILRSHSESHVSIMKALNISSNHNGELTGDFTQPVSLPVITGGKHPDLNSISIHTMAALMRGEFADKVASFMVLDCRYPYEYQGGHITNAVNWHHPSMVQEYLLNGQNAPPKTSSATSLRQIHIFHCEFSAERGPRAQRMLREMDRTVNNERYPALHFPELYLLEGGYKAFYEVYPKLCTPTDYVKMLDENHSEDLKFFRLKSKSWTAENKLSRCPVARTGPKRLGL